MHPRMVECAGAILAYMPAPLSPQKYYPKPMPERLLTAVKSRNLQAKPMASSLRLNSSSFATDTLHSISELAMVLFWKS